MIFGNKILLIVDIKNLFNLLLFYNKISSIDFIIISYLLFFIIIFFLRIKRKLNQKFVIINYLLFYIFNNKTNFNFFLK